MTITRSHRRGAAATTVAAALVLALTAAAPSQPPPRHLTGTHASGAAYEIDVPARWNGTVLLLSHGYRPSGAPNPATDAPDEATRALLLDSGYALAGSSYASTGWAVEQAVPDQLGTLDAFTRRIGEARRTIAWGESYGGPVTTAIAERHPATPPWTRQVAALHALERRIGTGRWGDTSPASLNTAARQAGPSSEARHTRFLPGPYPRPFNLTDRPTAH
ncbi:hypothetical protein [Streptomyces vilmorinianum]|uniref:hypothetical protein n=1 Tax=Streptomyces vilmorinianum TaxID=3051092 RepID=UPI003D81A6D9